MNRLAASLWLGLTLAGLCAAADPPPAPTCDDHACTRPELEAIERRTAKHLLRAQQARFEAANRGDDPAQLAHNEREFRRTQRRWIGATNALREQADGEN